MKRISIGVVVGAFIVLLLSKVLPVEQEYTQQANACHATAAYEAAKHHVRGHLKHPDSGKFASRAEANVAESEDFACRYRVRAYVVAPNDAGGVVRQPFEVELQGSPDGHYRVLNAKVL